MARRFFVDNEIIIGNEFEIIGEEAKHIMVLRHNVVDEDLYYFSFGTDDEEHFSNERSFAVSLETQTVYEYDVVNNDFVVME